MFFLVVHPVALVGFLAACRFLIRMFYHDDRLMWHTHPNAILGYAMMVWEYDSILFYNRCYDKYI